MDKKTAAAIVSQATGARLFSSQGGIDALEAIGLPMFSREYEPGMVSLRVSSETYYGFSDGYPAGRLCGGEGWRTAAIDARYMTAEEIEQIV